MASGRGAREVMDVSNLPHRSAAVFISMDSNKYNVSASEEELDKAGFSRSASIKVKKMTRIYDGCTKFPRLEECAHFHYEQVELGSVKLTIKDDDQENLCRGRPDDPSDKFFLIQVQVNNQSWFIKRSYENLRVLDKQLHRCIYDRRFSQLPELRKTQITPSNFTAVKNLLNLYLNRFCIISGSMINCGSVLSWMEMDNRGNRLMVTDDSAINTPAVAAAHVTRRYNAHASDEISFEVGDIISIIDMPPPDESSWWRGKRGFEVGFFPSDHVEVIGNEIPQAMASKIPETPPKPVLRKRGKLISFLRLFFSNRPARTTLKRSGIVKERVFGCDLGEHLLNSEHNVPLVLKCCAEVIEKHGIVDGIYRLSGVASNIHKLRMEFDEDRVPDLMADVYQQDIHSISSLLKMYFRELPNPLFTYQLYDKFSEAIQDEENRLSKIHQVVQQLPPPHYRTAEYLITHLARVSMDGHKTGMHCKNLAIVWAPNLLRSKDLEMSCNAAALQGVGVQAIVTEFLITYADLIFSDKTPNLQEGDAGSARDRPKSLAMSAPTKLLSLEEARQRALNPATTSPPKHKYIEVGGGPSSLPLKYHTVLDVPPFKKKHRKERKPLTSSGWRSFFSKSRQQSWKATAAELPPQVSTLKMSTDASEDDLGRRQLRSVKSADSLLSAPSNRSSQRRSNAGSSSDGTTYINPYAVAEETGRVSVSSTRSQPPPMLTPGVHDGHHQRSASCDYSYSDYEMEAEMPSPTATDDGVFVVDADMESKSLDGVSFYGGRSLPEEVLGNKSLAEEAYDIVYRSHMLQVCASSQEDVADSDSMQGSRQDSLALGEMVPIVTRSHSTGLYEDIFQESSPRLSTFSGGPPSDSRDLESITDAQRSRSLGHELDLETFNIPKSFSSSSSGKSYNKLRSPTKSSKSLKSAHSSSVSSPTSPVKSFKSSPVKMFRTSPVTSPISPDNPERTMASPGSPQKSIKERIVSALSPTSSRKKKLMEDSDITDSSELTDQTGEHVVLPEEEQFIRNPHFLEKEQSPGFLAEQAALHKEEPVLSKRHSKGLSATNGVHPSAPYQDINTRGAEGAHCEMASMDNLSHGSQSLTTDSETNFQLGQNLSSSDGSSLHGGGEKKATPLASGTSLDLVEEEKPQHYHPQSPSKTAALSAINLPCRVDSQTQLSGVTKISKALSVPADLQRSMDDLDSQCDMGSIGSFSELSRSLNSLLNDVESQDSFTGAGEAKRYSSVSVQADMTDSACSGVTYSSSLAFSSSSSSSDPRGPARIYSESLLSPVQEQQALDLIEDFKGAMESSGEILPKHLLAEEESSGDDYSERSASRGDSEPEVVHLASMEDLTAQGVTGAMSGLVGMTSSQVSRMSTDSMNMSTDSVTMRSDDERECELKLSSMESSHDSHAPQSPSETPMVAMVSSSSSNDTSHSTSQSLSGASGESKVGCDDALTSAVSAPINIPTHKDMPPQQPAPSRSIESMEASTEAKSDDLSTSLPAKVPSPSPTADATRVAVVKPTGYQIQGFPEGATGSAGSTPPDKKPKPSSITRELPRSTRVDDKNRDYVSPTVEKTAQQVPLQKERTASSKDSEKLKGLVRESPESATKPSDYSALTVNTSLGPETPKQYSGYSPCKVDILALSRNPDGRPRISPRPSSAGSRPSSAGSRPSSIGSVTSIEGGAEFETPKALRTSIDRSELAEDGTVYNCAKRFERQISDTPSGVVLRREKSPLSRDKADESGALKRDSDTRDRDSSASEGTEPIPLADSNKDTPAAKRKRSVKELTSQFEVTSSPPHPDPAPVSPAPTEIKFKPLVFQKPKVVSIKSFERPEISTTPSSDTRLSHSAPSGGLSTNGANSMHRNADSRSTELQVAPPAVAPKSPETKKKYESVSKRTKSDSDVLEKLEKKKSESPPPVAFKPTQKKQSSAEVMTSDPAQGQSDEREGNVRQISLMFERRSSLRGNERPLIEQSAARAEKLDQLEEAAIQEVEEKMKAEQEHKMKAEHEHKVRQLSQLFERQNSSHSEGRRSAERSVEADDRMARSASFATVL